MIRLILVVLWIVIYLLATLPLFLCMLVWNLLDPDRCHILSQGIIRLMMRGVLFFSGVTVTVKGKENIPENEAVLYVPNHRSYYDFVITFLYVKSPVVNIGKKELKYVPLFGQWVTLIGTLLMDRSSRMAGFRVIEKAADEVKRGTSCFIYPEGTRNKGTQEELLMFHEGSMKISVWSGCKTVPVAMLGTRDIYENHRPLIRPQHVTLVFGKPVDPAELTKEELKKYGAIVRERITEMILAEEKLQKGEN